MDILHKHAQSLRQSRKQIRKLQKTSLRLQVHKLENISQQLMSFPAEVIENRWLANNIKSAPDIQVMPNRPVILSQTRCQHSQLSQTENHQILANSSYQEDILPSELNELKLLHVQYTKAQQQRHALKSKLEVYPKDQYNQQQEILTLHIQELLQTYSMDEELGAKDKEINLDAGVDESKNDDFEEREINQLRVSNQRLLKQKAELKQRLANLLELQIHQMKLIN